MEAWFDLPTAATPPRYVMALLTWLAIWPLVSVSPWVVGPWVAALPYWLRTAVTSATIVAAMTYVVMPWVTRRLLPVVWRPSSVASQQPPAASSQMDRGKQL
jgi:uncharacterized protein